MIRSAGFVLTAVVSASSVRAGHPPRTADLTGQRSGVAHGGPVVREGTHTGDCVTPEERAKGLAAIQAYLLLHDDHAWSDRARPTFPFVPVGATLYGDLLPPGYVDHDPSSGFGDYSCHAFTYDGHAGTDLGLHSFEEQIIGVPVFAGLDGTVVYSHDGEPDMSTCLCGAPANALIIDHGNNRFGWYWHFRKNSVAFNIGDHVIAGQQIGFAASSGNSGGPHLHFGIADDPGQVTFDPFAGACGGAVSGWVNQPALDLHTYISDFGFSTQNLSGFPYYPYRLPNTGQMGFDQFLWFWGEVDNLPPHSSWRQYYIRPNGTTAFDSGDVLFESNQTSFYRVSHWWWYSYYISDMRTIAGTWHIRLDINGQQVISAPLEIKPTADPTFNRAPAAVTLAFDPPAPGGKDVVFCRNTSSLVFDDLDYDLVRYEYVWRRNGTEVRRITSAGRADAVRSGLAHGGDTLSCTVTPSDGKVSGPPTTVSVVISGCAADYDGDGFVTGDDFDAYVLAFENGDLPADFNGDGFVTGDDFDSFVAAFEAGC